MHKWSFVSAPFDSTPVNVSQKLLESEKNGICCTNSTFSANLSLTKLLLVRSEIVGLFVDTLTINYEYSRINRENLLLPNKMISSEMSKNFCEYFVAFLISKLTFEHFGKNEDHGFNISEVIHSERRTYVNT